jgi:hypothetical protein
MRIYATIALAFFFLVNVACAPKLQPAVQGEWSNVHNDKEKVSQNAKPEAEKPTGER